MECTSRENEGEALEGVETGKKGKVGEEGRAEGEGAERRPRVGSESVQEREGCVFGGNEGGKGEGEGGRDDPILVGHGINRTLEMLE